MKARSVGTSRLWEFEVMRASAILLVVLSHINEFVNIGQYQWAFKVISLPLGEVGNSLFFFISGYLLYLNNDVIDVNDLTTFYRKRILRIYPLYLIALVSFYRSTDNLYIYGLGLQGLLNCSNQIFWFIGAIFVLYLIYPVIIFSKKLSRILTTVLFLLSCMVLLHVYFNLFFEGVLLFYGTFVIGVLSAHESQQIDAVHSAIKNHLLKIYGILMIFILLVTVLRYYYLGTKILNPIIGALVFSLTSISGSIAVYFGVKSYGHVLLRVQSIIRNISFGSYPTYLIHGGMLSLMVSLLDSFPLDRSIFFILSIITLSIFLPFVFLVGYYIQKIESKLAHDILRI